MAGNIAATNATVNKDLNLSGNSRLQSDITVENQNVIVNPDSESNIDSKKNMQKMIDTVHTLGEKLKGEENVNERNLDEIQKLCEGTY